MFRVAILLIAVLSTLSVAMSFVVTSDDSGKYLAAASSSYGVFVSSDYGATWNATSLSAGTWSSIASDSSGKNLVVTSTCTTHGYCISPYTSKDGGATWTVASSATADNYYDVASEGTGTQLAAAGGGNVYLSSDAGDTWRRAPLDSGYCGNAVAYSADGSKFIYSFKDYIAIHVNGAFQVTPSPEAHWQTLSTDATGTVIVGAYDVGYYTNAGHTKAVYISTNGGKSYTQLVSNSGDTTYYDVTVTDDASLVFYTTYEGVFQYNVAKQTITKSNFNSSVTSVAASRNGQYVVAADSQSIWVSSDYGINFKLAK